MTSDLIPLMNRALMSVNMVMDYLRHVICVLELKINVR